MRLESTKLISLTSRIGNLPVCITVLWRAEHVREDVRQILFGAGSAKETVVQESWTKC
jgi:hypothetical protein